MENTKFQYTWNLLTHEIDNKDYSDESYILIADMSTPKQFWSIVNSISKEAWESGMFFFMRRGFKPKWDCPENEAGGAFSKKIDSSVSYETFVDMMVNCVTNTIFVNRKETVAGITISPKGPSSIVKVWNTTTTVSDNSYLNPNIKNFKLGDDVTYTPHKSRPI